jgi:Fuc2NAc and GlcNAc transferase
MIIAALLILAALTFLGIERFRLFALGRGILIDTPNERSNHSQATVRGVGAVVVASSVLGWAVLAFYLPSSYLLPLIAAGVAVAFVSFVDDLRGLPISTRLCGQLVAALLFLSAVPLPSFLSEQVGFIAWLWLPVAAFFMVAVINIYNFMDGIDGICAVHSLCVLVCWVALFPAAGIITTETIMCLCLGFPLLGFLLHNWSPAKVFMGDVGSTFLGLTFAALAMIQAPGIFRTTNFITLIMLMMPFLFDATFTIVVRILSGQKWYLPHNSHLFQRLVRTGLSHSAVASVYGGLTLYMGLIVALMNRGILLEPITVFVFLMAPYVGLYFWVASRERLTTG